MKKIYWILILLVSFFSAYGQKNLSVIFHYKFATDTTCAGVWHYNDNSGHEYALVGTSYGLTIFDITDPVNSTRIFDVPDTPGLWREVKVWSHYAYVSNEGQHGQGGGGITIVDMSNLPGVPAYKKYTGDSAIAGQLSTGHTVQAVDGYLYINGSNIGNRGTIVCSLADPWNPHYTGAYNNINEYVHDCFVRGDTLITSEIYLGQFVISSIANKANPIQLTQQNTPCLFNHSSWMSDNNHYLFTTDEKPGCPLGSYDISDFNNIVPLDLYWTKLNPVGEVHNPRVLHDFIVCSCYGDADHTGSQVTIVDAAHPEDLIEVGNIILSDTGPGLVCSWDADPFPQSGYIVATEITNGFFVLGPVYRRACYLKGLVTDCKTGYPVNNAKIEIVMPPNDTIVLAKDSSYFNGTYKTGIADSGTYDVVFVPPHALIDSGYAVKTVSGVVFKNGVLTNINVVLCGANSIDEFSPLADFIQLYPSPATNILKIEVSPEISGLGNSPLQFDILNVLGEVCYRSAIRPEIYSGSQPEMTIDVSKLNGGIYFLRINPVGWTSNGIKREGWSAIKRFVKM